MTQRQNRRFRILVARWLRRNTIAVSAWTVVLYLVLIPLSIWLFPNENLVTTAMVAVLGLTSSLASLGALLVDLDD